MKKILGLDLGTNSIGWALIDSDFDNKKGEIIGLGTRIIPMSQDILGKFDAGVSISQTAERTAYRSARRLHQRALLRRERLHRVLNKLGFLPEHYAGDIDFDIHPGQFKEGKEPKINYRLNDKGKHEFIFMDSFQEMVNEFKSKGINSNLPHDWTIYYLRKKALRHKISKEELAWVLLNFNQKRGYYQLRGEEEVDEGEKNKEFCKLKVQDVVDSGEDVKGKKLFNIIFENGWEYDRQTTKPEDWLNKTKEFIVTTSVNTKGEVRRTYKAVDSEKDWIAIKAKTEQEISKSGNTVGEYIFNTLLRNPKQKIRGKLIRTIGREFYKDELERILDAQIGFHPELSSDHLHQQCIEELYPNNRNHQFNIRGKGFKYLFVNDILFYQRPLKSKKSSISDCQYEKRTFIKPIEKIENGKTINQETVVEKPLKAISKSNPYYQEFRLWQFIRNLSIHQKQGIKNGKTEIDMDVTSEFLPAKEDWVDLFDFLSQQKEIDQKKLLEFFVKKGVISRDEKEHFRWNYVEDKKYPCNETRNLLMQRLNKVEGIIADKFLTRENEQQLWHLIYSIKDKHEFKKALKKYAVKNNLDPESFVENFIKIPPFPNEYGAYSEKAIKKLLPLMRLGKYWNPNDISSEIQNKAYEIIKLLETIDFNRDKITELAESKYPIPLLKSFLKFKERNPIEGLNTYQACYLIYGRHSEAELITRWKNPDDIENFLSDFKQHSLRNPIVEQVVTETLRVVRDIWEHYGNGKTDFFDEIHIELGRELKNPAEIRKEISKKIAENENTNQRIREILVELMNDPETEGEVRPYSPSHQELLKIYEEGVYQNPNADFSTISMDDVDKIRKNTSPTKNEINKYKLWLEQGYVSPYTGKIIPLSKLFTTDYEVEHIIPQSRYFDDSLSNKIICESEINQLKGSRTAYEFLRDEKGSLVDVVNGKKVKLFTLKDYENNCNKYFGKNRPKLKKLLSDDIPEGFINRQLNDSRYISKLIKSYLSNLVREDNEKDAISKHMVPVTGAITSVLKNDWGLEDKWNELISYRFKRLNELTGTQDFGYWDEKINAFRTTVPSEIAKGFSKKRIDHRHHALDALVIACTTKDHINYITSLNTQRQNHSLISKLRERKTIQYVDIETGEIKTKKVPANYHLAWPGFPIQAKSMLEKLIVSFKQNIRIINKTNNKTWKWVEKQGSLKKSTVKQTKGDSWAIRKPLHKETVSGAVCIRLKNTVSFSNGIKQWQNLVDKELKRRIKKLSDQGLNQNEIAKYFREHPYKRNGKEIKQVEVYNFTKNATASRVELSDKLTRKQLNNITDSGIRKILENHLKNYSDDNGKERFDLAFSPEGIDEMNNNITTLNDGKPHQPIHKVRIYEEGNKFPVGYTGNKKAKYVEAAKGTNLFFAVYWNEEKQKREYETIPLNEVIEYQKWRATLPKDQLIATPILPIDPSKGQFLFSLSPTDLVYVPNLDEIESNKQIISNSLNDEQQQRIYMFVDGSGKIANFIPSYSANTIFNMNFKEQLKRGLSYKIQNEYGVGSPQSKNQKSLDNIMIKEVCWKLEVDRLGNIVKVIK